MYYDPVIKLEGTKIPIVDEYKFLGVIFDRKLSSIPHIKHLKSNDDESKSIPCYLNKKEKQ